VAKTKNTKNKNVAESAAPRFDVIFNILASTITLLAIAWALDLPRTIGLVLVVQQYMVFAFGFALALVFLSCPANRNMTGQTRVTIPIYDILAAIISLAVCVWISIRFTQISEDVFFHLNEAFAASSILLVLIIEGLRRTVGWSLLSVALVFIVYGFFGHLIPGTFNGLYVEPRQLVAYLVLDLNAFVGVPLVVGSTIVVAFIFFGQVLKHTGGTLFFTDISIALMGGFRGGAAKIAIVASSLFGSVSGSAVSNVVSTGVITIPLMRKGGYSAQRSGAIEAVASTGGQLMPPVMGAAAFLMAENIQTPYSDVVLAALIPALLYYLAVFIQADLDAARTGAKPVPADQRPKAGKTFISGGHFLLSFVVLIVALFVFNQPPERAALYAAGVAAITGMVFGYDGKRMAPSLLWNAVRDTGFAVLDLLMIVAVAGFVIGVLQVSGLGFSLTNILIELAGDSVFLLLFITAFIGIVLGMGMPTLGVYVLLSALIAPTLVEAGFSLMASHMFVLYFGLLSMITPPIALAAFTAANLAKADPMKTGFEAVRYGWSAYIIPFIFIFAPELLFQGSAGLIAFTMVQTGFAVWLISVGASGYFRDHLRVIDRAGIILAGACLLLPASAMPSWAVWVNLAGLGLGLAVIALNFKKPGGGKLKQTA